MKKRFARPYLSAALLTAFLAAPAARGEARLQLLLPLGRVAYQTNEQIDVSVVRSAGEDLPAGDLALALTGDDGGKAVFTFAVPAVPAATPPKAPRGEAPRAQARRVEHLQLNGRLLRPGKYAIEAAAGGAAATASIEIYSHVRRSDFKLLDWGSRAKDKEQAVLGEDSMGFNLLYFTSLNPDEAIRGGLDVMRNCTMSGGHQFDLRMECDWSDPYALQGGEARAVREALASRTLPNCLGVHFYDEPGLTWWKHKDTGVMAPYNVPAQDRSFKAAFGTEAIQYHRVKPDDPAAVARWDAMNRWKESFMEAAWKYSAFGVAYVQPAMISATQSQYGWMAYADGYYFNVDRSLPVVSGHGGYSDGPGTYYYPSFFLEFGRMREPLGKPNWYLPTWYRMTGDQYRLEQNLSFMMGLQGMAKPPDMTVHKPAGAGEAEGVVETNKLMARLGTVFNTMPADVPEVAVLYAMSQNLHAQVRDMQDPKDLNKSAYEGGGYTRAKNLQVYLAGKQLHVPIMPVVEEDVLDGTLAARHKVLIVAGVDALEPKALAAVEVWVASGGVVLETDDSQVRIKGATKLGVAVSMAGYDRINALWRTNQAESSRLRGAGYFVKEAEPLAKAIGARLEALGIKPVLDADSPQVVTSRHGQGDVEYLFAVNATFDEDAGPKAAPVKSAEAVLTVAGDGRPVYDAVRGGAAPEFKGAGNSLKGRFRFGPGQMRVFARTARPIGGVQVLPPVVSNDYTQTQDPLRVEITAAVADEKNAILAGAIPLRVRVTDPLGVARYDFFRATDHGVFRARLPLAANDPSGRWTVSVRELLNDAEGSASFAFKAPAQCGALAGATPRAVSFGDDRDHAFRFFRLHQAVTVVKGSGDYNAAAADRLAEILKPWNVRCTAVDAADVSQPRPLAPEESATWVGLDGGVRQGQKEKPGASGVGFAVSGPVILLGTPEDNPIIKFAAEKKFLPYKPDGQNFPGPGRGFLSWQRDAVSYGNESVTLIAYDAAGMAEAVGTLYEAAAGIDPLTRLDPPATAAVTPASKSSAAPEAAVAWQAVAPDRVTGMTAAGAGVSVTTADGSVTTIDAAGKVTGSHAAADAGVRPAPAGTKPEAAKVPEALAPVLLPGRLVKHAATKDGTTALAYWGGTVQACDAAGATRFVQSLPADVGAMVWAGDLLVVGLADGRVVGLKVK